MWPELVRSSNSSYNYIQILFTHTSIFRPSTMVPCNSSLALSASDPLANVTKPKPFDPRSLNMISTSNNVPYFWSKWKKDGEAYKKWDFFVNKQKKINEKENIDKRRCVVVMDQIPENEFLFSQQWVWGKSFFCRYRCIWWFLKVIK